MNLTEGFKTGIYEILTHKMRSLLTMLGVILGVMTVVAMVSITEGAKYEAIEQFNQIGINTIEIQRKILSSEEQIDADKKSPLGLLFGDATTIKKVFQDRVDVACTYQIDSQITDREKPPSAEIIGITPNYLDIDRIKISKGRRIIKSDIEDFNTVCLIGPKLKTQLFSFSVSLL